VLRNEALMQQIIEGSKGQSISGKKETTYVEQSCIISKASGSKNGSRRSRMMENYKLKRNAINLLHSRPPEAEEEAVGCCCDFLPRFGCYTDCVVK